MGELEIRPNNFYKQRFFTRDGFLSAAYTDRTIRADIVSGSIQNQAGAERYIFSVSTPQIPKFGAYGSPNQQYLFLNIQDIVMENYAEPIYKVYKKRKPLTLVTGSYTDLDSSVTVFSSQVNYQGTIMSETFDGINKGFGQDLETQPQLLISAESQDNGRYILMEDVRKLAKNKGLTMRRIGLGGAPANMKGDVKYETVNLIGIEQQTGDRFNVPFTSHNTLKSRAVMLTADQIAGGQDKLFLQKRRNNWGTSEAWSAEAYVQLFKENRFGGDKVVSYKYLFGSESDFNKRGLTVYTDERITKLDRNIVEETANTTATQYNTLFNTMVISDNFNDIKTQTLETTGDDTEPYAYSMCYFSKDDKVDGPQALVMDNYWENYSGTATAYGQRRKINFPGVVYPDLMSGYQYPQEITVSIGNIPEIIPLELGSGSNTTTTSSPEKYSTVGEIEIVFKVKSLATVASGNRGVSDTEDYNTLRSMNFVFGSSPMQASERFWDYIYRMADGAGSFAAPEQMMGIGILNSGNTGFFRAYDMGSQYSFFTDASYYVGAGTASTYVMQTDTFPATAYVDIPYDEWVTMRIKIDPQRATQLCYFPDIQTGAGVMESFELLTTRNLACSGAQSISSLTINNSNFRSINFESTVASNANYALVADGDLNSDNRGTLIVDKISFKNYNLDIINASDVPDNPTITDIELKSPPLGVPNGGVGGVPETYLTTASDNYFMKPSCPMPGMIAIGYDSTAFIPYDSSSYDTGSRVDLFFSGYDAINTDSNPITKNLFRFGISTELNSGGTDARLGIPYAGMLVGSGGSGELAMSQAAWPNYSVESIDKSIDGSVQKGLIALFASGGTTSNPNYLNKDMWVRRESPFAQARILQVSPNGYKVQVDNTQIFSLPLGDNKTNYIFYKLGGQWDDTNHRPVEGSMLGFVDASTPMVPLYAIDVDEEGWVTLNRRIPRSALDDIHHYAIGPYKYWLNISYFNAEYDTSVAKWGGWYKDETIDNFSLNGNRSYSAVQTIGDVGEWGTTYNETVFTDSRTYLNRMNLTLGVGTAIETEVDYGWGAYIPATEEAEVVPAGYLAKEMAESGSYTFLDLSANQIINRPSFNEKETYLIFPWNESLESSYAINIDTATSTRGGNLYRPYMVYGYLDSLPVCGQLQVSPSVNFLQPDADLDKLTKSTATDVLFSWGESAEDVWYRLLLVDDTLIENKYHKVNFYAPLNEVGPYVGDTVNAYWYTAYDEYPDSGTTFISGTYAPRIEGAAGWAQYVSGNANVLKTKNTNTPFGGAEEFSIIVHCRPKIGLGTGVLMAVSSSAVSANDIFKITCLEEFDDSRYIQVQVSGAATGSILQSTTQYPFDGVQPLAIIVTYNKNRDNNNLRLYINGKLEDTNDYTTDFGATGEVFIGAGTDMNATITGYIEEITASTKEIFVPSQQGSYIHPTKHLADNTSNQLNKHQSKVFVMDYTNIRGATYLEVASTNTAAWNTTGVS